jgi:hypothetical protein
MADDIADFDELLNKAFDEIPDEVPLVPAGTWVLQGIGNSYKEASDGMPAQASLGFTLAAPGDDVDSDKLAEFGDQWKGMRFWKRYRFESVAEIVALKNDLKKLGIEGSASLKEMLANSKLIAKRQVAGHLGIASYKSKTRGQVVENQIGSLTAIA